MRVLKRIFIGLLAAAMLLGIALYLPLPDRPNEAKREDPPVAAISIMYRDAELVLLAGCMRITQNDEGLPFARFTVDEVLAGHAEEGEVLSIPMSAEPGKQYLLYLKKDAESGAYMPVSESTVTVEDGMAYLEGRSCTLESIRDDMERQKRILTVPAQKFFYNELPSLIEACDEIVVAKVLSVSEPTATVCRSGRKGESIVNTLEQVFMRVRIENGLYGSFRSGDKLSVVLEPYYVRPVINATDLSVKTVEAPPESLPQVGRTYIFFLLRSDDVKSDIYFTVNPYEGYVLLIGNTVRRPYYNSAMGEINDLRMFAERLREIMKTPEE